MALGWPAVGKLAVLGRMGATGARMRGGGDSPAHIRPGVAADLQIGRVVWHYGRQVDTVAATPQLGCGILYADKMTRRSDMAMDSWFKLRVKTARIWNEGWGRCLEPRWQCANKPVKAHSIQNARIIDRLAENGHVVTISSTFHPTTPPCPDFRRVGRNKATTFEGLCAEHDSEIFRRIDAEPIRTGDAEQLFLLSYRAATRELHTTMAVAYRAQASYKAAVELGLSPGDRPCKRGMFAVQRMAISYDTFRYRSYFDEDLLAGRYDRVCHKVLDVPCARPTLAVSSLFSIDSVRSGDDCLLMSLSILPLESSRTVAVFSWRDFDGEAANAWLSKSVPEGEDVQMLRRWVSRIALEYCENIIFAPSLLDSFSADEREKIRTFYVVTARQTESAVEPLEVDLFL